MSMLFDHRLRILSCEGCGAPINAEIVGCSVQCEFCKAVNRIQPRDESADLAEARAGETSDLSELERLEILRRQEGQPLQVPECVEPYSYGGGELSASDSRQALDLWVATRKVVKLGGTFGDAELLFHLTLLLAPNVDQRHRRALLENAAEVLSDKGQRHILRCMLAEQAVLVGDSKSADKWLRLCNPKPTNLRMDTAYRLAVAAKATAAGESDAVLRILGRRADEVPMADGWQCQAALLRAHALECGGALAEATSQLIAFITHDLRRVAELDAVATQYRPLVAACRSHATAADRVMRAVDKSLRPTTSGLRVVILGIVLAVLIGITIWSFTEVDDRTVCQWFDSVENCKSSFYTNIWTGPAVISVILTIIFFIAFTHGLKRAGFRRRAVLEHVRVRLRSMRVEQEESSSVSYCDLDIFLPLRAGSTWQQHRVITNAPILPGAYPCLVDPVTGSFELKTKL
jgi:hypothetical protein